MIPSSIAGVASAPVNPNGPQGISGSGMPLQGLMSGSVPDEMMPLPNVPEEIVHDAPRQIPTQGTESMKVGVKSAKEVCPKALQDITVRRQLALSKFGLNIYPAALRLAPRQVKGSLHSHSSHP